MIGRDAEKINATRFIRKLPGGSQPILVEASDGYRYVLKFLNNPQGHNIPFNECVGYETFCACGLNVPAWKPIIVTNAFIDDNPQSWIDAGQHRIRPSSGCCFGSRYLETPGVRLLELLPKGSFPRIAKRQNFWTAWLIDLCFDAGDNRQAVFREHSDRSLDAFFIDMGHLLGGPKADQSSHFLTARYLDRRVYVLLGLEEQSLILRAFHGVEPRKLRQRIQELPEEWCSASTMLRFERGLNRLKTDSLVRSILEMLLGSYVRQEGISGDSVLTYGKRVETLLHLSLSS